MNATTDGVTGLLAKYNEALNASSTDAVMPLYAEDGVFMPLIASRQLVRRPSEKHTTRFLRRSL